MNKEWALKTNSNNIIIFPTDTVYGMGVPIYDEVGLQLIYQIKKRPHNKAIVVLCANLEQAKLLVEFNKTIYKLASFFWPGPLTLILKTTTSYFQKTGKISLGIRIPKHPLALKLLNKYGPLQTTSVNINGKPPLNDYNTIYQIYHQKVKLIYPNDCLISTVSSTIVDATNSKLVILRQGTITQAEVQKIIQS
ncbi:L-threonylcarbamoyladenylate synthase [Candidatus Phytoplasma solani]|uniref:L-threonylcarbamoyladenylate synthase n=1 Tax=Candidatus Phytoplasma solani TaxID=69896 RepID=A0A421NY68_9MOLU|nr:L-threonylcarbamoyladenylate synthase [Candidatus Phytoplasma solani]RMI88932.1 translation factor SUA5 [Candidatus Phytoplasma solani]CCP88209.1 hypothetical protein, YrdC-like domain protein [Candidatus Phytoplasma solani]CCP88703.1 translation factor [Candidatus Phytoplasma solani]